MEEQKGQPSAQEHTNLSCLCNTIEVQLSDAWDVVDAHTSHNCGLVLPTQSKDAETVSKYTKKQLDRVPPTSRHHRKLAQIEYGLGALGFIRVVFVVQPQSLALQKTLQEHHREEKGRLASAASSPASPSLAKALESQSQKQQGFDFSERA